MASQMIAAPDALAWLKRRATISLGCSVAAGLFLSAAVLAGYPFFVPAGTWGRTVEAAQWLTVFAALGAFIACGVDEALVLWSMRTARRGAGPAKIGALASLGSALMKRQAPGHAVGVYLNAAEHAGDHDRARWVECTASAARAAAADGNEHLASMLQRAVESPEPTNTETQSAPQDDAVAGALSEVLAGLALSSNGERHNTIDGNVLALVASAVLVADLGLHQGAHSILIEAQRLLPHAGSQAAACWWIGKAHRAATEGDRDIAADAWTAAAAMLDDDSANVVLREKIKSMLASQGGTA